MQEVVGAGLRDFIAAGKREELFLVGKIWQTEHRPADARSAGADHGRQATTVPAFWHAASAP